jgi:hypothetical protein
MIGEKDVPIINIVATTVNNILKLKLFLTFFILLFPPLNKNLLF